jgi:deferrochelatase/peroxidase EfeB
MVGRWRSGCPVELSPDRDDLEIAADPLRNNDFSYGDDPRGVRTPLGAHVRRVNPRDTLDGTGRLHRILRRGAAYGPMLPEGVLDDDGENRGLMLSFVNADPGRGMEGLAEGRWSRGRS